MSLWLDEDVLERVRAGAPFAYRSWQPERVCVVLGRSNAAEREAHADRCAANGVPILRRRGGGGAVVLAPGMLVVSLAKCVKEAYHFTEYFHQINGLIMDALREIGVQNLTQQGISDICLADRKILGSSMYRSKALLFYPASLMISNDLALLDRYLKHPSKEPEYRQGRPHREFVATLAGAYPALTVAAAQAALDRAMPRRISEIE